MLDYLLFPWFAGFTALLLAAGIAWMAKDIRRPGTWRLLLLFTAVLGWIVFNTLELVSRSEAWTLTWGQVCYLFIVATPVFWLQFFLYYFNYPRLLRFPLCLVLWIIPLAGLAMIWSNDLHFLFWRSYTFVPAGRFLGLQVQHGIAFFIFWGYAYFLLLTGLLLIAWEISRSAKVYRNQSRWLITGGLIVLVVNGLYVSQLIPGWHKDYTPIGLALGVLCFFVALFRYQFLSVVPIRRQMLFDALDEGILVLDVDGKIISINPAAQDFFGIHEDVVIGHPLDAALPHLPLLAQLAAAPQTEWQELQVDDPAGNPTCTRSLRLTSRRIEDVFSHYWGMMLMVRDATREKRIEQEQQEEREFALALSEIAAALNSTRELDPLLDLILRMMPRITGCDSANIMLIDGDRVVVVRSLNPTQVGISFPIAETESMRWMIENRQAVLLPDVREFPSWITHPETAWVRSYVGAPIVWQEDVLGIINLDSPTPNLYNGRTAEHLMAVANHVSIAIQNARIFEQLQELAVTDELTGIANRRGFFALAIREFERAQRYQRPLAVLMLDIDHFKQVNDRLGHPAGDVVLRRIAQICAGEIRKIDLISRYGGEEFVFALTETTPEQGRQLAERIRARIEALIFDTPAGQCRVTVSLGVAGMCPKCQSLQDLIGHADQALYQAKQVGRNRVAVFSGEE